LLGAIHITKPLKVSIYIGWYTGWRHAPSVHTERELC